MIKMLVQVALATAAFAAAPAIAQNADTREESVYYGDLNLASQQGAAALEGRVKAAARRICGVEQAPGLAEHMGIRTCRAEVLAGARPQMSAALARQGSGSVVVAASR